MGPDSDAARYRARLVPVEDEARAQPWAAERPWRADTHVGTASGMAIVDLHDLGAAAARRAVREVLEAPPDAGAVVFVHGRGNHTLGPSKVLRNVVHKELRRVCAEEPEWSFRPMGLARTVWISDRRRAPRAATGDWSWGFRLLLLLFAVAFVVAVLHALVGG